MLCEIDPQIYEVFEITKLNKLFTIHKDEQAGSTHSDPIEPARRRVGFSFPSARGQGQ